MAVSHCRCSYQSFLGSFHSYFDTLVVPIIDNTAEEQDLTASMASAMLAYPEACAVLVRRHGVYVWGDTWEKCKTMCECYDYLFEIYMKVRWASTHLLASLL